MTAFGDGYARARGVAPVCKPWPLALSLAIAFSAWGDDLRQSSLYEMMSVYRLTVEEKDFVFDQLMLIGWAKPCEVSKRTRMELAASLAKWMGDTGGARILKDPNYKPSDIPTMSRVDALNKELVGVIEFAEKTPIPEGFMSCDDVQVEAEKLRRIFAGSGSLLTYRELKEMHERDSR
jgi:hypothetical protein